MATPVSQFELLFKDQAPVIGLEVETVLQGYFLEISNLEERDFVYALDFVAIAPSSGLAERGIAGNTIAIFDSPGASSDDNAFGQLELVGGTTDVYGAGSIELRVAARATALFAVIPQVTPLPTDPIPVDRNFEVRGYVEVRLPAVDSLDGEPENGTLQPQSPRPVRALVTPQNRAAFYVFPNANSFAGGELRNQVQACLPTASGGALVEIEPQDTAVPA